MMNHSKEKMTTQWRCNTKASIGLTWFKLRERKREANSDGEITERVRERERAYVRERGIICAL